MDYDYNECMDRAEWNPKEKPHGWIQWKGTDVCIDIHCKCGEHSHFDGDFLYTVQCPSCGACYMLNPHIELVEIPGE